MSELRLPPYEHSSTTVPQYSLPHLPRESTRQSLCACLSACLASAWAVSDADRNDTPCDCLQLLWLGEHISGTPRGFFRHTQFGESGSSTKTRMPAMPASSTRVPARREDPPNQVRRASSANMPPRRRALKSAKPACPVAQATRSPTTSTRARNVTFAPGPDQVTRFRSGDPPNQVVGRAAVPNMQPRSSALKSAKRSLPTFHLPRAQPGAAKDAKRARIRARRVEKEIRAEGGEGGTAGRRIKSAAPSGARRVTQLESSSRVTRRWRL
ncbi:unnamed protein product (mitochondrion) [Plasmodiophora brassicae]|uniref:Uncharacterized protein n=1 Tax=Plasmodiophora brassicae TaxID=37360 RepID=A0A0G4J2Q6_PLABS|nr:hypothetical protein PBRA_002182 [Plasmodiophora brassicae]SPQ93154.1 unnamed protein product [Plasmodiophora brassicae]